MKAVKRVSTVLHLKRIFPRPKTAAIILAGGSGTRMGTTMPKQLIPLLGVPVIMHTAIAFQKCRTIDEIVLVVRREEVAAVNVMCRRYGIKKCHAVVAGGLTRQESAEIGFLAVSPKIAYVAFHDAARCMITPVQIKDVATAAYAYHAASAGCPATDTVKTVNAYGFIEKTIPRDKVWLAQTPQIFDRRYYAAALSYAGEKNLSVTDDNSLMEYMGQRVRMVDTGDENFKITHMRDIVRAEDILRRRGDKKNER